MERVVQDIKQKQKNRRKCELRKGRRQLKIEGKLRCRRTSNLGKITESGRTDLNE